MNNLCKEHTFCVCVYEFEAQFKTKCRATRDRNDDSMALADTTILLQVQKKIQF